MSKRFHWSYLFFLLIVACDPCKNVDCGNGVCSQEVCVCKEWWTGDACSEPLLRMNDGEYELKEFCDPETLVKRVELTVDFDEPDRMMLDDEYYIEFDSDTTFIIPVQAVGTGYYEGMGKLSNGRIEFDLFKRLSTSRDTCQVTGKRL